ncbi:DUF1338 domain-containing protein [Candidatus Marinamargulisbacteria bacterium SCGC AAA071-K20]|nr:DUF1338 domain-containing protein [Candidatus Marinamargulisbacteria bacterium SCGC AAA071-K20]
MTSSNLNSKSVLETFRKSMSIRPNTTDHLLVDVLVGLLEKYFNRVPDAAKIFQLIKSRGDTIFNDHIAFRAFELNSLLKVFLPYDYKVKFLDQEKKLPFNFESKKLTAVWLKHPNPDMPRIFISSCRLEEFPELASTVGPYLEQKKDFIDQVDFNDTKAVIDYLHTPLWPTPTYKDYQILSASSEYLGWVFFNKYYLNHFTLSIHKLKTFDYQKVVNIILNSYKTCKDTSKLNSELRAGYKQIMISFNQFLKDNGLLMNSPKGKELNISPDQLLLQSSTKAQLIEGEFSDGINIVPGSYVEFAYRGLLDNVANDIVNSTDSINNFTDADFKEGFEVSNADKIFESTYLRDVDESAVSNKSSFEKSKESLLSFLDRYQHDHPELQIF